jgi:hypothetical protein
MPGPPTVRLPQGVPFREVEPEPNPFWAALGAGLGGGADQGMDPTTQAIAAAAGPRRRTTDIQLDALATPPPPDAPAMFRAEGPASMAMAKLEEARAAAEPTQDDIVREGFVKGGWTDPGIDWASERAGFLAQGNADREAEDAGNARMAQNALMPGGRSAMDALSDDVRFGGLQRARQMQNPAFARQQRQEDTIAGAQTFMDPRMKAMRDQQQQEGLASKISLEELGLMFAGDPRRQKLDERDFLQSLKLAQARSPYGFMSGGNSPAPRGTGGGQPMSEEQIRSAVLAAGGDENDVLETIADAESRGILTR